ncbi:MAG: hypothetical protein DI536_30750 [Archangium gephyra]|uniref:Uncharacterized protein n=1 Tax=Archangium gephyra TaxID=48 RepID=A0A2W5T2T5_9BACT|nr:MAG: hypothetical protein DI536_30750 [Archangium gephyra]
MKRRFSVPATHRSPAHLEVRRQGDRGGRVIRSVGSCARRRVPFFTAPAEVATQHVLGDRHHAEENESGAPAGRVSTAGERNFDARVPQ